VRVVFCSVLVFHFLFLSYLCNPLRDPYVRIDANSIHFISHNLALAVRSGPIDLFVSRVKEMC
jgi:hypothetical protein